MQPEELSPVFQVQSVMWFYRKHLDKPEGTRVLTDHQGNKLVDPSGVLHSRSLQSRFSIRLFSLLIFRAGPADSGVYICGSSQGDFFYGHDLDIQEARKIDLIQRCGQNTAPVIDQRVQVLVWVLQGSAGFYSTRC